MRSCPNCAETLVEQGLAGERVDRCPTCSGIFFDQGELEAILGLVHLVHEVSIDEAEIDHVPAVERAREMRCPADGEAMDPEVLGTVVLDRCPACDSIWLDGGEITALKLAERTIRRNLQLFIRLGN